MHACVKFNLGSFSCVQHLAAGTGVRADGFYVVEIDTEK